MTARAQTIQIFLPSGDPRGVRIAEITTRIVRVIEVPRSLLAEFMEMPEAEQVGVYFLFGEDEDGAAKAYIGQTGSLRARLAQHNSGKAFWNRALISVSRTNSLTNTHVSYLEWMSIQQAQQAARYLLDNGNAGGRPHTPAPLQADCMEIHDTVRVLLATLGYPLFEPLARPIATADPSTSQRPGNPSAVATSEPAHAEAYFARASGADARGLYTQEGFVVLGGSTGRSEVVPSFEAHGYNRLRQQLLQKGVLTIHGDRIRLERDYLFNSPSAAAGVLMGRTANGPLEWKDREGHTLWDREMKPREAESTAYAEAGT
jgi:hypothetical protein